MKEGRGPSLALLLLANIARRSPHTKTTFIVVVVFISEKEEGGNKRFLAYNSAQGYVRSQTFCQFSYLDPSFVSRDPIIYSPPRPRILTHYFTILVAPRFEPGKGGPRGRESNH